MNEATQGPWLAMASARGTRWIAGAQRDGVTIWISRGFFSSYVAAMRVAEGWIRNQIEQGNT